MDETLKLLLVEDNPGDARLVKETLAEVESPRFEEVTVATLAGALAALRGGVFDCVLLDLTLPDSTGIGTVSSLRAAAPDAPLVVLTGAADETLGLEALKRGAQDYLVKGRADARTLVRAVRYAVERMKAERELRYSEERYRSLVEVSADAIFVSDGAILLYANRAGLTMLGCGSAGEVVGRSMTDIIHSDFRSLVASRIEALRTGALRVPSVELKVIRSDGSAVDVESTAARITFAGRIAVQTVVRDITERKAAQAERERLLQEVQRHALELERRVEARTADLKKSVQALQLEVSARRRAEEALRSANRALTVVSDCGMALVHASDEAALLNDICRIIVQHGGYEMAWVGVPVSDKDRSVRVVAHMGFEEGYLKSVRITWADEPHGRGPTGTAIRESRTVVGRDFLTDPELAPWREAALKRGYASSIALPLVTGGAGIGALTIYAAQANAFGEEEVALLEAMAADLTFGIMALRLRDEQKRMQDDLRSTNELLERMFSNIHMLVAYMDADFNFIRVNRAYAEAGAHPETFYVGKNHFALYPNAENEEIFGNVVRTALPYVVFEKPFTYAEFPERGTTYWDWSLQPVLGPSGAVVALVLALLDVTGQKRAKDQIVLYQEHLRTMASELVLAEEETKRRIAKDLHDEIGQTLAFCQLRLGTLKEGATRVLADSLDEVRKSLTEVISATRSLTFELSPPVLYELGLRAAVERLLETIQHEHGLITSLTADGQSEDFSDDVRITLYMAIRELLTNVVKHGRARNVSVSITGRRDGIRVTVQDDGIGFDVEAVTSREGGSGGFGLFSIRERLEYLGGSVSIESVPGRGATVTLTAPIERKVKARKK